MKITLDEFDEYYFTIPLRQKSANTLYRYKISTGKVETLSDKKFEFAKQ